MLGGTPQYFDFFRTQPFPFKFQECIVHAINKPSENLRKKIDHKVSIFELKNVIFVSQRFLLVFFTNLVTFTHKRVETCQFCHSISVCNMKQFILMIYDFFLAFIPFLRKNISKLANFNAIFVFQAVFLSKNHFKRVFFNI